MSAKRRLSAVRALARAGKCSPSVTRQIVELVSIGATYETAATASGVCSRTLKRWRLAGEAGEQPYAELLARISEARAMYLAHLLSVARRALITEGKPDGRLALEMVRMLDPENYGRRDTVVPVPGAATELVAMPDWSLLTDDEKDEWTRLTDKALGRKNGYLIEGVMVDPDVDSEVA